MKVKIYKPAKSAMQSGKAKNKWLVELIFEKNFRHVDDLMGWVSADTTLSELKFGFNSKEEAINFAKNNHYNFLIEEPKILSLKKKSYSDNFTN